MADKTSSDVSGVLGKITGVQGKVILVGPNGEQVNGRPGDDLLLGSTVKTLGSSIVVIQLDGYKSISLGHDETLTLTQRLLDSMKDIIDGSIGDDVNFELLAQAIESGDSIEELLPATAAGGENTPTSSGSSGGSSTRISMTGDSVKPESGFETSGFVTSFTETFIDNPEFFNSQPFTDGIANVDVNEDSAIGLNLSVFFADDDAGQILTFSVNDLPDGLVFDGETGTISGAATNDAAFSQGGEYIVSVTATDDSGATNDSVTTEFTLSVNNVNDSPFIGAPIDLGQIDEDNTLDLDAAALLDGAGDIDIFDVLSISDVRLDSGSGEVIANDDGTFSFAPSENWFGEAQFSYTVIDNAGGSVDNAARLQVASVNDAPVVSAATSIATEDDAEYIIDLLDNASDVDGDSLTVSDLTLNSGDASGITIVDNIVTVDPSAYNSLAVGDADAVIQYNYNVVDGNGGSVAQTATISITPENDAPVVSSAITSTATEDDAEYTIDLLDNASDVDGDSLTVSGVTLDSGDASGISIVDNIVTVDPDAYTRLAVGDADVVIQYSYNVVDGNGGSVEQTATITITPENDAPIVSSAITSTATEGDAEYMIDLLDNASDVDGDSLTVSGVTLDSGDASGISIVDNIVTVDPNAYTSLAVGDADVVIQYSYNVIDGNGGSVAQTATITITPENDAPVVSSAITSTATEDDASYTIDLLDNASDVDGDSLSVSGVTLDSGDASGISIVDNIVTVDPDAYTSLAVGDADVVIQYSYSVIDGNGGSVGQTATITITPENDAPVVSSAITSTATEDDAEYTIDLLDNASDVDGDSLTVSGVTLDSGDASGISIVDNIVTVDPNAYTSLAVGDADVVIQYSYNVVDGNGGSVAQTATITITPENDAPVVSSAITSTATEDDAEYTIDLLDNASDVDGDSLSVSGVTLDSGDASGISIVDNIVTVDPDAYTSLAVGDADVVIQYSYNVIDGNGASVPQTATITITPENDAPVVSSAITSTVTEDDTSYTIDLLDNASDVDGDSLSVSGVTLDSGDASGISIVDNIVTVDPDAYTSLAVGDADVVIQYSYNVVDGNGGSVAQTATITITPENDAPVVSSAITSTATEDDASYTIDLLDNASDVDGDSLSVSGVTLDSGDASGISIVDNIVTVDPNAYTSLAGGDADVVIQYSYNVIDGNGGSVAQTATITITPENDAPVVSSAITSTATEDDAEYTIDLLDNASDVDGDSLSVSGVTLDSGDASGISIVDNIVTVDPDAYTSLAVGDADVVIQYSYNVVDGNGGSVAQTATITITPENDAPVVSSAITSTVTEDDTSYTIDLLDNASDVDGDSLTVSGVTLDSGDASGISIVDNIVTVDPDAYTSLAVGDADVVIQYSYNVVDGNGGSVAQTATITITPENDAPVVSSAITSTATEDDAEYTIDLLDNASDVDGDSLTVSGVTLDSGDASGISIVDNIVTVDPDAYTSLAVGDADVVIQYSYNVVDGNGGSVAQTATITITPENDAPVVSSAITSTATEDDAEYTIDLLDNASDVDGDSLSVSGVTLDSGDASGISIVDNIVTVDPNAYTSLAVGDADVVIQYSYNVIDGNGGSVAQTATITITPENDAPVISSAITSTVTEDDASYTIDLLDNASDVDGDSLTVSGVTLDSGDASGISIVDNIVTVDPNAYTSLAVGDADVVIQYSYNVIDGNGGSVAQTATITITPENDAPVVSSAITSTVTEDDASYTIDLLDNASDVDGDSLTVSGVTLDSGDASGISIVDNIVTVDPDAYTSLAVGDADVVIQYSYNVIDGNGASVPQTATITITPENDAPVVSSVTLNTNEDTVFTISEAEFLVGSSDVDGDTLSVSNVLAVSGGGSFDDNNNGTWTFTPTADWSGDVSFTFDVTDGTAIVGNTGTLTVDAVADDPTLTLNSNVENEGEQEVSPPTSTGLLLSLYDDLNNTNTDAAAQEAVIDAATPTSEVRVFDGFGTTKEVTNTNIIQSDGSTIEIGNSDSYSITGLIYLEAGSTYEFQGFHDDSLRVELGGETLISTIGDSYGNYGPNVINEFTPVALDSFTATENGYYSVEVYTNNISGQGQFSLNLVVDGGEPQELSAANFNIYASVEDLASVGGQVGTFVESAENAGGGYYPTLLNTGGVNSVVTISNLSAALNDLDGSESLVSITVAGISWGGVLTDGNNIFYASEGNDEIDVLTAGWDLSNIQVYPTSGATEDFDLTITAVSEESSNGDQASDTQTVTVTVKDVAEIQGDIDVDLISTSDVVYSGIFSETTDGTAAGDVILAQFGNDVVNGLDGNDVLSGGHGNDTINGGDGIDLLYGDAGNDILSGGDDEDIIFGGVGNDTITGGLGNDTLSGGDGSDTFVWRSSEAGEQDTVTDFTAGVGGDILDLSELLQGESADAATLDSYLGVTFDGTDTTITIDIDGDGLGTDMTIVLEGVDLASSFVDNQAILQDLLTNGNIVTD